VNTNTVTEELVKALNPTIVEQDASAAVAVILKETGTTLQLLLVKRAESPSDPWSGQVALPGGKRSAEDRNLKETVIRETMEEISLNLLLGCRFLGTMEPVKSTKKPEIKVLPFVVLLESQQNIKLNEELTEHFWVSLEELTEHSGTARFSFGEYPAYSIGNYPIWGLTYKILHSLLCILGLDKNNTNAETE